MSKKLHAIIIVFMSGLLIVSFSANAKVVKIMQKDKTFELDQKKVEAIEVKQGDTVEFENADPFFHNIFSLSDLKTFDLGSYEKGKSKTVVFDKKGKVEVECAIHPQMFLEVKVE